MELQIIRGRQTAAGYTGMLKRASLLTEGLRFCGNDWILQQDNGAIYNARKTKDFLMLNNVIHPFDQLEPH